MNVQFGRMIELHVSTFKYSNEAGNGQIRRKGFARADYLEPDWL